MDNSNGDLTIVNKFMEAVANANEKDHAFVRELRDHERVVQCRSGVYVRLERSGWILERYIEADTRDGRNICWWFDLGIRDREWVIRTKVYESDGEDIEVFPDRLVHSVEELVAELEASIVGLTNSEAARAKL